MKGTVQGYFERAFDKMTDKELRNPLANSGLGAKAKLVLSQTLNAQRSTLNSQVKTREPESGNSSHYETRKRRENDS